jgi:hypothetical protein
MSDQVLLDIGCGAGGPRPGHIAVDRHYGVEAYPLQFADECADGIVASHILEHFAHGQIGDVLAEWARVLKPGGTLKIAVPDFAKIAENYLSGVQQPTQGFVMGGQVDAADFHKALFDEASLKTALAKAGLMLIRRWESELADDCASLPISLNLAGTKPHATEIGVSAVMSVPRLGFMDTMFSAIEALPPLKVSLRRCTGAYWGQCLERAIEEVLRDDAPDAILTLDYDSVFTRTDAAMLMQLMCCYPEADAISAVQAGRGSLGGRLFTIRSPDEPSQNLTGVAAETFAGDLAKVTTAHFGLTLIRAEKLRALPKPWFHDIPAPDGSWNEGRTDADIAFWRRWEEAGNSLYIANRVPIGHLELGVLWPAEIGTETTPVTQPVGEWRSKGKPEGIWR